MLPDGDLLGGFQSQPSLPATTSMPTGWPGLTCIYAGSWTQAIPEELIRDRLLKAAEVRVWCVLRTYLKSPSEPVTPTYEDLCRDGNMARATLSRSLKVLRLTRWLTSRHQRDSLGLMRGTIYILHDRRLDAGSALMLDPKYPAFVAECAVDSTDERLRRVALWVAEQMPELYQAVVPTLPDVVLSSVPELFREASQAMRPVVAVTSPAASSETELSAGVGSSVSEPPAVQIPSSSGGCSALDLEAQRAKSTTTTTPARAAQAPQWTGELHWPSWLQGQSHELAIQFLSELPHSLRHHAQDVLDELAGQHRAGKVDRPLAYLGGLIRKVKAGTFTATDHTSNARRRRQREAEIAADLASIAADGHIGARHD